MKSGDFDVGEFLATLSGSQQRQLLEELLIRGQRSGKQQLRNLMAAEMWLEERAVQAGSPPHAHARYRMWFIFMLLRHGALRIPEIFALKAGDFDPLMGLIHVSGKRTRIVPLPPEIARHLASVWKEWPGRMGVEYPFQCDASLVRRMFKQCATACGMAPELLAAGSLRKHRAFELEAAGLHPALVSSFLGQPGRGVLFSPQDAFSLIRKFIQERPGMKTSARNVFRGPVSSLKSHGILVEVTITTADGIKVTSVITETSRKNLALEEGKQVAALVKAPWVSVVPADQDSPVLTENHYRGKVESMQKDALACEMSIALPGGTKICALHTNGPKLDESIKDGSEVIASFSAFSVILTEA